jgi:hypothetical protein
MLVNFLNDPKFNMRSRFLPGFPRLYESFFVHEKIVEKSFPKIMENFVNLFFCYFADFCFRKKRELLQLVIARGGT